MFEEVFKIVKEKYQNDTILLVVTAEDNVPSVRSVDSFFYEDSFWVVTDLSCNYVKQIQKNPKVMISDGGHNRFWCDAVITGHPLDSVNLSIREVYLQVFHHWYKEVNNEALKTVCFIKATPYKGYVHKDKLGYRFNKLENTLSISEITHHIDVKLEPFWE